MSGSDTRKLIAGVSAGVFNTYIFNPYDKALFLHTKHTNSFFDKENWTKPYKGVTQALLHRVISYGMYFPIYDIYNELTFFDSNRLNVITSGVFTGCTTALLLNPINVIKFHGWNNMHTDMTIINGGKNICKEYGFMCLARGMKYTLTRDIFFGVTYSYLNFEYNKQKHFFTDFIFAIAMTSIVSPINYCRNVIFHTQYDLTTPTLKQIIRELTKFSLRDILLKKLCIGYGTVRVGLGMACSRKIYDFICLC